MSTLRPASIASTGTPAIRSLRDLARLAEPHADAARAVSRTGRVVAASEAEARVAGLSAHAAPGATAKVGDGFATVTRVDRAVSVLALDRPGARPDDAAALLPTPPRVDGAWLGRTVDALGAPLHATGEPDAAPVDLPPPDPDRPVVTGVGAIDALVPVMPGEAWAVRGAAGSGRTTLLRMIAECGAWDAVVLCALAPRSRERVRWSASAPNRLTILPTRAAGPAEADAALALAVSAARDLARTHPRTVLLVDGPMRLPSLDGVTAFVAMGDAEDCWAWEGAVVLDAAMAALGIHPAIDIAATLAASPPPPTDDGTHAALRSLAAQGGAKLNDIHAALAQSPGTDESAPDPGAIVTRSALADMARHAASVGGGA